jgi:hypothetical protein
MTAYHFHPANLPWAYVERTDYQFSSREHAVSGVPAGVMAGVTVPGVADNCHRGVAVTGGKFRG